MNAKRWLAPLCAAWSLVLLLCACSGDKPLPETLRVGTIYSPTNFFILRGDTLGYEYERISDFATDKGLTLEVTVAGNMRELIDLLQEGKIDVAAVEIPQTAEYKALVLGCGATNETTQVLVQPAGDSLITDVTQLIGREVAVVKGSRYEARLRNLDNEVGGGILIRPMENDTLLSEDLVDMVAAGTLQLTIIDSDLAQLSKTYHPNIDISLQVSFPQRSSWAVALDQQWLADSINAWAASPEVERFSKAVKRRYFELSKLPEGDTVTYRPVKGGVISSYDDLFRKYAPVAGVEWQLLAAIGSVESGFKADARSWAGARGIMQVMPSTGRAFGVSEAELNDPEKNIEVAAKSLAQIEKFMRPHVADSTERVRFVLASYNAGMGHIMDAIALAKKHGHNPQLWYDNVETAALMKSNPQFYNDPVCRYGYFRARETVAYVKKVENAYHNYRHSTRRT
ncbi:MAG: transglycosylase SLT domain-containing protein [Muribaculaceae bacterium]|nr:transglycosylase SLT domain-containing protein [Muribaculaceae bacterium]